MHRTLDLSSWKQGSRIYHWTKGPETAFDQQTLGNSEGQGSLVCCSPRDLKELDTTEWLDNNHRFPRWLSGEESTCQGRRCRNSGLISRLGRPPGEKKKWQLTLIFLPGKFHGRGTWWAIVHGVAKSRTWLSGFTFLSFPHSVFTGNFYMKDE